MFIWQRLRRARDRQVLQLDLPLIESLQDLAEREQRTTEAVATDLLTLALQQRQAAEANLRNWALLSPREQQVTALVCLSYSNAQIAARLNISPSTVKTHVSNVLRKFGLERRSDLRLALAEWDFSAFD
jgi:two-component system, NarL family, response regulator NreC